MNRPSDKGAATYGEGARSYRLDIQYDGAGFYGWARQPGRVTVEEELEKALALALRHPVKLAVAGRTDTGVHARGQVASFRLPRDAEDPVGVLATAEGRGRVMLSVNAVTPRGLVVREISLAPDGFDARRDAVARSYRYFIRRGLTPDPFRISHEWHVRGELDVAAMQQAAHHCLGPHDFTAFTPTQTKHLLFRRDLQRCEWRARGSLLWLEVRAPHFLRHMVRSLVGTMVEVGRGRMTPDDFEALLEGSDRSEAGPTAPPHGLFLWRVYY